MPAFIDQIRQAHARSGAPGAVIGWRGDARYRVRLQSGAERWFRLRCLRDGRVRVLPSWSVAGQRQRKQATSD